jgi:hypothetical protein
MKNKTLATWLTFFGGPLGLHRFYLCGLGDLWGWLLPLPTALGLYGIERVMQYGQDDQMSWWLIPLLGFNIAACGLNAIVYGLMTREKWNALYNPGAAPDALPGRTTWFTIGGVAVSLHHPDVEHRVQLSALFRIPDPGRPEDQPMTPKQNARHAGRFAIGVGRTQNNCMLPQ